MGKFEERLWSIIRNFLELSQSAPQLLVMAVQIVELQELVDAQLVAAGESECGDVLGEGLGGWDEAAIVNAGNQFPSSGPFPKTDSALTHYAGSSPLRKLWRRRCLQQISNCIQDRFAPLLQKCSQLIAAGQNTDKHLSDVLTEADGFVAEVHGCRELWGGCRELCGGGGG
jgi:hypothetical protein